MKMKNNKTGTGEMACWLGALAVPPEVLGLRPSSQMVAHKYPKPPK